MVFNLDPLDIDLDFERKRYRLGDTITATVTFMPKGNVEVRSAVLNLMGQVRRTKTSVGRTMGINGGAALQGGNSFTTTDYVPMQQQTEQQISTEVFGSAQIVLSGSLRKGEVSRHRVTLRLDQALWKLKSLSREAAMLQRDSNSGLSIEPWWLEARADVAMGRDAVVRRQVEVVGALKATT